MDLFLFVFAFMMGLMSLLSPCVLPVIPSYVAFLFGREKTGIIMGALAMYIGIFVGVGGVGILLSLVGLVHSIKIFYVAASVIMILLIIDSLGGGFLRQLSLNLLGKRKGVFTGFIFGLLLMLVAAPCTIPLFTTTAIYALTLSEGISRALVILAYALGLGLPLVLIGLIPEISGKIRGLSGRWWNRVRVSILICTLIWLLWSISTT
jgi:cytochrome c-type biogenesis protein